MSGDEMRLHGRIRITAVGKGRSMKTAHELKGLRKHKRVAVLFACLFAMCVAFCLNPGKAHAANSGYITVSDGYYKLKPAYNRNLALDIYNGSTSNRANASLYYCQDGHPNQVFYIQYRRTYRGIKFYSIRAVHSGKYLDVYEGRSSNGTNLIQYQWNGGSGSSNQLFCFYSSNGNTVIQSMIGSLVMDINGGSLRSGTNVQLWSFNNSRAQLWYLQRWTYQARPNIYAERYTVGKYYARIAYTRNVEAITCTPWNNKITYYTERKNNNYNIIAKGRRYGSSGMTFEAYNRTWGWVRGSMSLQSYV